jgi:hypothetical protein
VTICSLFPSFAGAPRGVCHYTFSVLYYKSFVLIYFVFNSMCDCWCSSLSSSERKDRQFIV